MRQLQTQSALMLLAAAMFVLAGGRSASASIIVGFEVWDSGDEAASVTDGDASGLAHENAGDWRENNYAASNDGDFGTLAGASAATGPDSSGTWIGASQTDGSYDFTVTAGVNGLILQGFHFDAVRKRGNAARNWSLEAVAGAITLGAIDNGSLGGNVVTTAPSDMKDFDVDLTALADNALAPGESATFRLALTGGSYTNNDQKTYLDNVAIRGTSVLVPEPASLAMLGVGGLLIARRRR